MRSLFFGAAALVLVASLGACSPGEKAPAPATTPAAAVAPAAAPTTEAAPAPEVAAAPAAAAAQTIALEIKDASGTALSGDTGHGQTVFKICSQCHSAAQGKNMTGPSLYGIVGRPAGSIPGFRYSEANRKSGITWSEQEMYVYLENPKKKVPGTIMAFAGLPKSQDRADVIAYLKVNAQQ
jgi:cytochrome c